ncbi:bsl8211 [Bradyrhizobium diazoefficiens USDA 110]|uniref:Bsl8211 protein n=2 Tax=Bradyrhizobium TaxID=374 RepID=Q89BE4_BRADU|nr:hypothetical protein CIT37_15440 [Bradyrhizobium ottawaense]MYV88499.1 hypothetical protein [Bradyrhizobium japonicum]NLS75359.1 hypothetical protein [Bradyrhizobium brasilense]NWL42927.1 hypothetical protein [Bradyrhizobium elkanii]PDT55672.1 hypothetical protein CO678_42640 [Bradyrhizobium diazoefficiens]QOZ21481.1 hypothetical protein XI02_04925 [Bradyrhizobium sp. CCBAU 21365]BAC53476.1 bsl8211 [Bradyrhizobium diazoefficiens USDA 110]
MDRPHPWTEGKLCSILADNKHVTTGEMHDKTSRFVAGMDFDLRPWMTVFGVVLLSPVLPLAHSGFVRNPSS